MLLVLHPHRARRIASAEAANNRHCCSWLPSPPERSPTAIPVDQLDGVVDQAHDASQ
jgi:hypothetical protein